MKATACRRALTYYVQRGVAGVGLNQNGLPNAAIFGRDYGQLDFSGNLDLGKVFGNSYMPTLVVNVINITKEAQSSYFQFPTRPSTSISRAAPCGWSASAGRF